MQSELSDNQVKEKQRDIKKLLEDSFKLEHSNVNTSKTTNEDYGQCLLRFYQMTAAEYATKRDYTLTVLFGDKPSKGKTCEGFTYDVRDLLEERYLVLKPNSTAYVPIPLSPARWNWLHERIRNLSDYSRETGKLAYPLTHEELIGLLRNIKIQPTICSTTDRGCVHLNMAYENGIKKVEMFDESIQKRFGPPSSKIQDTKPMMFSPSVRKQSMEDMEKDIDRVFKLAENELKGIEAWSDVIDQKLHGFDKRDLIKKMLESGSTVEQASGVLVFNMLGIILGNHSG